MKTERVELVPIQSMSIDDVVIYNGTRYVLYGVRGSYYSLHDGDRHTSILVRYGTLVGKPSELQTWTSADTSIACAVATTLEWCKPYRDGELYVTFDSERRQWRAEFGYDYGFGTTPRNAIANIGQNERLLWATSHGTFTGLTNGAGQTVVTLNRPDGLQLRLTRVWREEIPSLDDCLGEYQRDYC